MKISSYKSIILLSVLLCSGIAFADVVLSEIEKNIAATQKRMKLAQENTADLEKAINKVQANIDQLQKEINKKQSVKERSVQLLKEYGTRISQAEDARKEFMDALEKDRKELELIRKDILVTKKKLGALTAAEEALSESIEVSEESLEKISGRRRQWGDNRSAANNDVKDTNVELETLKKKLAYQERVLKDNTASLKKWRQSHVQLAQSLADLTRRLKAAQREQKKKK